MQLRRFYQWIGFALLVGIACSGCAESDSASTALSTPLEGYWLLSITQEYGQSDYRDVSTVLVSIRQEDGSYRAKIKGNKPAMPRPVLEHFDISGERVKLVLKSNQTTYDFEGVVGDAVIRGNMDQGGLNIEPAVMEMKPILAISEAEDFPATAHNADYQRLLDQTGKETGDSISLIDHYESFREFCEASSPTPLSLIVSHKLAGVIPRKAETEADIKAFAKSYLKRAARWSERMEMFAHFHLGRSLCEEPRFADLGLEYLSRAEKRMTQEKREDLQRELGYFRQMAEHAKIRAKAEEAFALAQAGDEQGLKELRKLNKNSPFDPVLMYQRAEAARLAGETNEAIRLNAKLATWPQLQAALAQEPVWTAGEKKLPESVLLELWSQEKGSLEGLEAFKDRIYEEAVSRIAEEIGKQKTAPGGNRVGVMELFTGAGCGPCVGADLATSALEEIYSPDDLIVLRHHVHSNGLDPLTNPHNIQRFQELLGPDRRDQLGTPSIFINGKEAAANVGGYLDTAVRIGRDLQKELRPALEESSPIEWDLSAYRHNDEITISTGLDGVQEELKSQLRVHLLLAEKGVDFPAQNGIRRHDMITRWYFSGSEGIEVPTDGRFEFSVKTRLGEIRDLFESSTQAAAESLEDEVETIPLDLDDLHLVGLVQHVETREILQAGIAPVKVYDTAPMLPMKKPETGPSFGPSLVDPQERSDSKKARPPEPKSPAGSDSKKAAPPKPESPTDSKPMTDGPVLPKLPE